MSEEMMQTSPFECPAWFDGKKINETVFCEEFLRDYPMVTELNPSVRLQKPDAAHARTAFVWWKLS